MGEGKSADLVSGFAETIDGEKQTNYYFQVESEPAQVELNIKRQSGATTGTAGETSDAYDDALLAGMEPQQLETVLGISNDAIIRDEPTATAERALE